MLPTVLLKDIVDALEMQLDECSSFLDLDTGQVETLPHGVLRDAEESADDNEEEPDLPEWQKEAWEIAKRIVSTDRFIRLPTKFDVHEWAIMEEFSQTVEGDKIRDDLLYAIHGAGAFRHFKYVLRQHHIEKDWFKFREEALRQIAIDWCEENHVTWK